MLTIRRVKEIHHEDGGWFDARWHFSFDRYRDPEQMGVGALRVFNDEPIVAGADWRLTGAGTCTSSTAMSP
jgi:quercetin 2,3-dioxygenase